VVDYPNKRRPIPKYNGTGEAQVVFGEQLSNILQRWKANYLLERNPEAERVREYGRRGKFASVRAVIGPEEWLSQETGIHDRRIRGLIRGEYKFVPLTQADAVLTALDKQDLLKDILHVIPNPNWSPEKWAEYMRERGCF
jgi:hypothetical protein